MESMIDILFDQLVDSDAAWDTQHDKATQDALAELCEKLNLPTVHETKLGELISTEAVAQARAGFRAGFVAAMKSARRSRTRLSNQPPHRDKLCKRGACPLSERRS